MVQYWLIDKKLNPPSAPFYQNSSTYFPYIKGKLPPRLGLGFGLGLRLRLELGVNFRSNCPRPHWKCKRMNSLASIVMIFTDNVFPLVGKKSLLTELVSFFSEKYLT